MLESLSEQRTLLGRLSDGAEVWTRLGPNHLDNHPDVVGYLPEVFGRLSAAHFDGCRLGQCVDLGRTIGVSHCVPTGARDLILFARRKGRLTGCSRFALGRQPVECRTVAVYLLRNDDGLIILLTAYIGELSPPEPHSKAALADRAAWERAVAFWRGHALALTDAIELDREYGLRREDRDYWGQPPEEAVGEAVPAVA